MKVLTTAALTSLAILAGAAPAGAVQRYAAPEGKGPEPCAQGAPCSLQTAVSGAKENDEVIVTTGSYSVPTSIILPAANIYVHGDFGAPMPKLNASVAGAPFTIGQPARFSYLDIAEFTGEGGVGFVCTANTRIERVRVQVISAKSAYGLIEVDGCEVKDSLIRAQSVGATGVYNSGNNFISANRNLTVVAIGTNSVGAWTTNTGSAGLSFANSILSGELTDVLVAGSSKAFLGSSNFDTSKVESGGQLLDLGGNQPAPPLFVDAGKNDYREAAGSPTIDAGVNESLGALDLDGNARVLGAGPDIGAFEFVPPIGQLQSLEIKPKSFKAKKGTTVSYSLSAAGGVEFTVERKSGGRKAGKKCVKQTAANKSHKKCGLFKPLKGGFSVSGATGANSFKFAGKLGGKALKPGSYRLIGAAGGAVRKASFTIVK